MEGNMKVNLAKNKVYKYDKPKKTKKVQKTSSGEIRSTGALGLAYLKENYGVLWSGKTLDDKEAGGYDYGGNLKKLQKFLFLQKSPTLSYEVYDSLISSFHSEHQMLPSNKLWVGLNMFAAALELKETDKINKSLEKILGLKKDGKDLFNAYDHENVLGYGIDKAFSPDNQSWFFSLVKKMYENNLVNQAIEGKMDQIIKSTGEKSDTALAIRTFRFSIYENKDQAERDALLENIANSQSAYKEDLRDILLTKDIELAVKQGDYDKAENLANKFPERKEYWLNYIGIQKYVAQGEQKDQKLRTRLLEYADKIGAIKADIGSKEFYSQLRKNLLAINIYVETGKNTAALEKIKIVQQTVEKLGDNNLKFLLQIYKVQAYAAVNNKAGYEEALNEMKLAQLGKDEYENLLKIKDKTKYESQLKNIQLSKLSVDQKVALFWAAVKISKIEKNTDEIDKMTKTLGLANNNLSLQEKAFLAEGFLVKADILMDKGDLKGAIAAINKSEQYVDTLAKVDSYKGTVLVMRTKIDDHWLVVAQRKGAFAVAQRLLEKQLGLNAKYEFKNELLKDQKNIDRLLSLARILVLSRETKQNFVGQRQKINAIADFLTKNQSVFKTNQDKLRFINFQIAKNTLDYKQTKQFQKEQYKGDKFVTPVIENLVSKGEELVSGVPNDEMGKIIKKDFYQSAATNFYKVAVNESEVSDSYLQSAWNYNELAGKTEGKETKEVKDLAAQIIMRQIDKRSFIDKLEVTNASLTMTNEVKTNKLYKKEATGGLTAENTEKAESSLQTYSFNLEAGYPFTQNLFLFGRIGLDAVSGNQQIKKEGEQIVYYQDFNMFIKDDVTQNEVNNLPYQFKGVELGLKPYWKALDLSPWRTDLFIDLSGRYEKLFPGMQDQEAVGEKYSTHSFTLGGGTFNKFYPLSDYRDIFNISFDLEGYSRWQFNRKLPDVTYNGSTYDIATEDAVDNNIYDAKTKNDSWNAPSSYYWAGKVGFNYSGEDIFGGVAGGIRSYKEGFYDPMSIENKKITNPFIEAYLGTALPYDFQVSLGFSHKFGENAGNSYSAEINRGGYFVKGSWFNASKSSDSWLNNTYDNNNVIKGTFSGQSESTSDLFKIEAGFKQNFSFME